MKKLTLLFTILLNISLLHAMNMDDDSKDDADTAQTLGADEEELSDQNIEDLTEKTKKAIRTSGRIPYEIACFYGIICTEESYESACNEVEEFVSRSLIEKRSKKDIKQYLKNTIDHYTNEKYRKDVNKRALKTILSPRNSDEMKSDIIKNLLDFGKSVEQDIVDALIDNSKYYHRDERFMSPLVESISHSNYLKYKGPEILDGIFSILHVNFKTHIDSVQFLSCEATENPILELEKIIDPLLRFLTVCIKSGVPILAQNTTQRNLIDSMILVAKQNIKMSVIARAKQLSEEHMADLKADCPDANPIDMALSNFYVAPYNITRTPQIIFDKIKKTIYTQLIAEQEKRKIVYKDIAAIAHLLPICLIELIIYEYLNFYDRQLEIDYFMQHTEYQSPKKTPKNNCSIA